MTSVALPPRTPPPSGERHATHGGSGGSGATRGACPEERVARVRTPDHRAWRGLAGLALLALGSFAAPLLPAADEIKGPAPVSVSAANYRTTERGKLLESVATRNQVNPAAPTASALAQPQLFVFLPGEIYASDVTYEDLCRLLTPALASRGYENAADEQGLIREPGSVQLVLRVHYGTRPWRNPTVRTEQLTWRDGLEPKPQGRGLHTLGGDVLWDSRAGGNDDALSAARENQSSGSIFGKASAGGRGGGGDSPSSLAGGTNPALLGQTGSGPLSLTEYELTRDFHLIVVDAFDYAELKSQGKAARRLWTTFVAAPKDRAQPFSAVAKMLVRNATPFFGETSRGLQVYTDARAEVTIGEAVVVPE